LFLPCSLIAFWIGILALHVAAEAAAVRMQAIGQKAVMPLSMDAAVAFSPAGPYVAEFV
jgi:hypothetical protein